LRHTRWVNMRWAGCRIVLNRCSLKQVRCGTAGVAWSRNALLFAEYAAWAESERELSCTVVLYRLVVKLDLVDRPLLWLSTQTREQWLKKQYQPAAEASSDGLSVFQ
jgi:hypothetical protein